jgi:hypothetical protein
MGDSFNLAGFVAINQQRHAAARTRLTRRCGNASAESFAANQLIQLHCVGMARKQHVAVNPYSRVLLLCLFYTLA